MVIRTKWLWCLTIVALLIFRPTSTLPVAESRRPALVLTTAGSIATRLMPGAAFSVTLSLATNGIQTPCLGLASMNDAGAIPVTLGPLHAARYHRYIGQFVVPLGIFPAEPPGAFLLYAGSCTRVAPEGNFGDAVVTILPAAMPTAVG